MNYNETVEYLYSRLPVFQRIGAAAYKKSLDNIRALCESLGNPQWKYPTLHIAGTNGKGSTSSMLAAIFQASGYKTGLFTSPHLASFTERIRVNGIPIPEAAVVSFTQKIQPLIETIEPSFFEVTTAMGFAHFADTGVDIAVIEVGMGGRLDSTNLVRPELCIITNISWDHQQFLGDTLAAIAGEKAGIIKPGVPVIIGEKNPETSLVFQHEAARNSAEILFAQEAYPAEKIKADFQSQVIRVKDDEYLLDLPGIYQLNNLPAVLAAAHLLRKKGWNLTDESIHAGLGAVRRLTGLRGRMEVLQENPLVICDVGHNEAGIREVLQHLAGIPHEKIHFVWGAVNDKEIGKILKMLPRDGIYYFVKPDLPRGLDAGELARQAAEIGLQGRVFPTVKAGLEAAIASAGESDLVFAGGSTFVVAEVIA